MTKPWSRGVGPTAAAFPGLEATIRHQSPQLKQPSIDFSDDNGGSDGDVVVASHGRSPPTRIRDDYYGGQLPEYEEEVYDTLPDKGGTEITNLKKHK